MLCLQFCLGVLVQKGQKQKTKQETMWTQQLKNKGNTMRNPL